jgi:Uma2 family endonuclease
LSPTRLASPDVRRLTVDEYERIVDQLDDDRVELIDGYLVTKMPKKPPHVWSVDSVEELLRDRIAANFCLRRESPVRIPDYDEPEPDVTVVRGPRATYRTRHPGPEDVALVVEVSDSTYDRDRGPKWVSFAKAGIPVYWIVNLVARQVEVYTRPGKNGYRTRKDYRPGQHIPIMIGGVKLPPIAVDGILP